MKMEERGRNRSVQRGCRHAKFSEKRNRAFRSVELEFFGVIIAIIINKEINRDRKTLNQKYILTVDWERERERERGKKT